LLLSLLTAKNLTEEKSLGRFQTLIRIATNQKDAKIEGKVKQDFCDYFIT